MRDDGGEAAQAGAIGRCDGLEWQSRRGRHVPRRRCPAKGYANFCGYPSGRGAGFAHPLTRVCIACIRTSARHAEPAPRLNTWWPLTPSADAMLAMTNGDIMINQLCGSGHRGVTRTRRRDAYTLARSPPRQMRSKRALVRAYLVSILDIALSRGHADRANAVLAAWKAGQADVGVTIFGSQTDAVGDPVASGELLKQAGFLAMDDAADLARFIGSLASCQDRYGTDLARQNSRLRR